MLLQLSGGGWDVPDWSPDDRKLLLNQGVSANESYIWLVDVSTGEKTLLTPKGNVDKINYGSPRFSADGRGVYLTTDKDSESLRLAYMDLATKQQTFLGSQIRWDVDSFALSPDGKTIAYVTNEDGVSRVHLLDTKSRKEKTAPSLPVGIIGGLRWHENNKDLGFNFSSARTPADVYSLDVRSGKVERWTESETGGLNTNQFAQAELVKWNSFDGRSISGFLYKPPAKFTGARPVVINIHGGPEDSRGRVSWAARLFFEQLGVAMIFPNVRGSTGFGRTFLKLDNGFLREDSYKDIGALLDWIKTQPTLDANRVMVSRSYGGHMTFVVAQRTQARFAPRCRWLASQSRFFLNAPNRTGAIYGGLSMAMNGIQRCESLCCALRP